MRLNRVLLLAATINILIFALVFTISCSDGKNGNPGAKGVGCVVNEAWQIMCDGEQKGQLSGDAPRGPAGANGANGADGDGCYLGDKEGSSYPIYCGNALSGYLDGCDVSKLTDYEIVIACGSTTVNLCKGSPFNTEKNNCSAADGTLLTGPTNGANSKCDGRDYDSRTHYCGFVRADSAREYISSEREDGVKPHTIIKLCPGVSSPNGPNETLWRNEFCEYTSATAGRVAGGTTGNGLCEDGSRINEGDWKKQYCGYPEKGTRTTATNGACDNPGPGILTTGSSSSAVGPNAIAFRQGYCQASKDGKTTYSEKRCNPNANPLTDSTTNRPNFNTWKYQYCGYKSATSTFRDTLFGGITKDGKGDATLAALCDDGKGPHLSSNSGGYCGWIDEYGTYGSSSSIILKGGTVLLSDICTRYTNKNPQGPNATGWKNEYCAYTKIELTYSSSSLVSAEKGGRSVTSGRCELTTTLSSSSGSDIRYPIYSITYSSSAGYGKLYATTTQSASGPNQTFFNGGFGTSAPSAKAFCTYDPFYGKTRTSGFEDFCNDNGTNLTQMNKDSWKKQYCSKDAISSGKDKLWNDACDDGTQPNSGASAASNVYCGVKFTGSSASRLSLPNDLKTTVLTACAGANNTFIKPNNVSGKYPTQYCGVNNTPTPNVHILSTDLCGDGFGPAMSSSGSTDWKPIGGFCRMPSASSTYTILSEYCGGGYSAGSGRAPYNQGSWKNEYCFAGSNPTTANSSSSGAIYMVKTCPGGWVGDVSKYGGLPDTVRCDKP